MTVRSAKRRGRSFARFWRHRLEEQVAQGMSLDAAAEQTIIKAIYDFGRLAEGTKGYDFLCALSILVKHMPSGKLLRKWDNKRQIKR